jgi:hypothetical protein
VVTELTAVVYWGGMFVLFFFWVYGIVSFGFDLKNKIIPGLLQYRRGRRKQKREEAEESERDEREQQLY